METNHTLVISKYQLWKLLHKFGFRYEKVGSENRRALCERSDIVRLRNQYLGTIRKKRTEGYEPVYLDETWVNASHTTGTQWFASSSSESCARKLTLAKGERLIVLHTVCKSRGFLSGCSLVFKAKSKDNRSNKTTPVDEYLTEHGHSVLRSPSYHCDLNPIELIWGIVKSDVGRQNVTFKLRDVQTIVQQSTDTITQETWQKCVEKVEKEIERHYWTRPCPHQASRHHGRL
ncbi:uncharacterized protein [Haliotis asinina]|uniref:uncharacterized protein n=1 Tax=Haliotis asinina TaxID=109174 RepID=UPI0035324978